MKLHEEWLMRDLQALQGKRQYAKELEENISRLQAEYTSLKAARIERISYGNGNNHQLEKIEDNIADRECAQLHLNAVKSHISIMENLLNQLDPEDKQIIEGMIVYRNMTGEKLAEQLDIDVRTIFNRKSRIIDNLLRLRFGKGYRP